MSLCVQEACSGHGSAWRKGNLPLDGVLAVSASLRWSDRWPTCPGACPRAWACRLAWRMHAVSAATRHCVEDGGWGCAATSGSLGGAWPASWSPEDVGMLFGVSTTRGDAPWGGTTGASWTSDSSRATAPAPRPPRASAAHCRCGTATWKLTPTEFKGTAVVRVMIDSAR